LRLLLDTAYLLPAIGISIKGLPVDALIKLMGEGHEISVSDISIFELSAKGAKYVNQGTLPAERVIRGIRAIVHEEKITMIPIHESGLLQRAFQLRNLLSDFIDCLIISSAINCCDVILTEDADIQDLKKNREFDELLTRTNPKFQIQTLTETL